MDAEGIDAQISATSHPEVTSSPRLVSVIMPVYNGEAFIGEAIESVLSQIHAELELIVVDDGSTDGTSHIVLGFTDSRIRYVHQENKGGSAALNHGLQLATGEYVTYLDCDDLLTPDSLRGRAEYLDHHPGMDAVYGDGYYCDEEARPLAPFTEYRADNYEGDVYGSIISALFVTAGGTVMIRRSFLERYHLRYDEQLPVTKDWDFLIRVAEIGKIGHVDMDALRYRLHGSNVTLAVRGARRYEAVKRTKYKVLCSPRFAALPITKKSDFFYALLMQDLKGHSDDRQEVISNPQFRGLPRHDQSRLLRLVAGDCLVHDDNAGMAKSWLTAAWRLAPLEPKAALMALLATLSLSGARLIIRLRRLRQRDWEGLPTDVLWAGAVNSRSSSLERR